MTNETKEPPREVWCTVGCDCGSAVDVFESDEDARDDAADWNEGSSDRMRAERYIHESTFDEAIAWLRERVLHHDSFASGPSDEYDLGASECASEAAAMLERLRDGGEA